MAKIKDKEALRRFRLQTKLIFEQTQINPFESDAQKQKRIERAKKDYAYFVEYYFPHYAKAKTAKFQLQTAKQIKADRQARMILMWARGHAKSTHADIFMPLWLKIQDNREFNVMVLVGKSYDAAATLLGDIQAELQYNQRYINDFGPQIKIGDWEEGQFATRDDRAFFALGRGQSPRGLRYHQYRPDYIVMDDVDDDEIVRNPARIDKLYDWTLTALLGAMAMGRGRFIAVGNKIAKNSIIARLSDNPAFKTIRIDALDKNGKPSWPENYTLQEINALIEQMGYRRAQKELFNNPITEGSVFKPEWIRWEPRLPYSRYKRLLAYIDPSFKSGRTADYKAVVVLGTDGKHFDVLQAFVRKTSIAELVRWLFHHYQSLPDNAVCEYYMEANFAQDLIIDEFDREAEKMGIVFPLRKDLRKKPDKFARVEALSPLFEKGLMRFNKKEKNSPDMITLVDQLLSFEKGSKAHDDGPDALEGGVWLLSKDMRSTRHRYVVRKRESRKF